MKVSAGLVSSEVFLIGLQVATFSLCPHIVFPLSELPPGVAFCVQISFSYKDISQTGLGTTLMTSF